MRIIHDKEVIERITYKDNIIYKKRPWGLVDYFFAIFFGTIFAGFPLFLILGFLKLHDRM